MSDSNSSRNDGPGDALESAAQESETGPRPRGDPASRADETAERHGIGRREFLTSSAKYGLAAAVAPTIWVPRYGRQAKSLKIMQWSHFVPSYDVWFDKWAKAWGEQKGVDVTVDHIALSNLGTRANAEVSAQSGHDLFQFLSPPGAFEPHVLDMADMVQEAESHYGPILELAKHSTYNPVTKKWFGFSDNYVPDPGDYLKSIWSDVGMPNGPSTWEDLVKAGPEIRKKHPEIQIPIGLGMSQELDSNMAGRAVLWSFGGSVQDANENVVLDSDATRAAIDYMTRLFKAGMNDAVLSWNAASNNQALNAQATSYILNSISAYRTAQDNQLPVADDIFFVEALKGPHGDQWASEHVMGVYVIWKFAENPDVAKQFLLDLLGTYRDAVKGSKLYNFPSFPGTVADASVPVAQKPDAGAQWLKQVTSDDPFGSTPPNKLAPIGTALKWSTNQGHPGPANPATGEVFDTFVLPTMFAKAATGQASPKDALDEAVSRTKQIYEKWRKQGLVGGGGGDR
jgi:multiple sugar transport system substrate-binding protein